jgi:hypothetical protein
MIADLLTENRKRAHKPNRRQHGHSPVLSEVE